MTKLPRPPLVEDRLLSVVGGQWLTAREIFFRVDEGSFGAARLALIRLANAGKIERRYDPHPTEKIARYRKISAATTQG